MNALPLVDAGRRVFRNHRALSRAHLHTPMRARERARMCRGARARTHIHTYAHIHITYVLRAAEKYAHSFAHTHTHIHTYAHPCSPRSSPPSSSIIECHRQRRYFPQKAHARTQPRTHIVHSVSSYPEKASVRFVPRPSRSHSTRPLRLMRLQGEG